MSLTCLFLTGIGGLGMSIEGPGKVDIKCFENPGGTCRVAYKPTEPGTYQLSVKYADIHVPGSVVILIVLMRHVGLCLCMLSFTRLTADNTQDRLMNLMLFVSDLLWYKCVLKIVSVQKFLAMLMWI